MIDKDLKELIKTNLKLHMPKDNWVHMDSMFEEMYLVHENGMDIVCLNPPPVDSGGDGSGDISMMFLKLNGSFYDIGQWSYIKENGKLL